LKIGNLSTQFGTQLDSETNETREGCLFEMRYANPVAQMGH